MTRKERPWGFFDILAHEEGMWVKRVSVHPEARLSLQKHSKRTEHWIVVSGEGVVQVAQTVTSVVKGSTIAIALGMLHRISNTGAEPLVFVEVGVGSELTENDIERIEDDYSRVEAS